jgi:hypothetical protein
MTEMIPDITRPPGVVHVDGWHLGDRPHRFLYGKRREVPRPAVDVSVGIIAVQLDDGSIDDGSVIEAPKVFVDCGEDDSLTPAQARQVARAIMGAVDGLDGDDGLMAEFRFFAHAIWLLILCALLWLLTYALTGPLFAYPWSN